jgi:hypothetical protein
MDNEGEDFEHFWSRITSALKTKTKITNWSVDKGNIGKGDFDAWYESGECIKVDAPKAENVQSVPKEHFELVFDQWHSYCERRLPRYKLRDNSRFTKYTISIIHHFIDKTKE